jgi:hypothetical protein
VAQGLRHWLKVGMLAAVFCLSVVLLFLPVGGLAVSACRWSCCSTCPERPVVAVRSSAYAHRANVFHGRRGGDVIVPLRHAAGSPHRVRKGVRTCGRLRSLKRAGCGLASWAAGGGPGSFDSERGSRDARSLSRPPMPPVVRDWLVVGLLGLVFCGSIVLLSADISSG